jgi:hypothetical protein
MTALLGGVCAAAFAFRGKSRKAIATTAFAIVIVLLIANRMILPELDAFISARPAAARLMHLYEAKPDEVAIYHLPRAYEYGLDYYFGRDLPQWTPETSRALFLFYDARSRAELERFPEFAGKLAGTVTFVPATPDGKIYVRLSPGLQK